MKVKWKKLANWQAMSFALIPEKYFRVNRIAISHRIMSMLCQPSVISANFTIYSIYKCRYINDDFWIEHVSHVHCDHRVIFMKAFFWDVYQTRSYIRKINGEIKPDDIVRRLRYCWHFVWTVPVSGDAQSSITCACVAVAVYAKFTLYKIYDVVVHKFSFGRKIYGSFVCCYGVFVALCCQPI